MTKFESFALWIISKIVIAIGLAGAIGTIFMDRIARGFPLSQVRFDWLQILALCVFIGIAFFGVWVDIFLNKVIRRIIEG